MENNYVQFDAQPMTDAQIEQMLVQMAIDDVRCECIRLICESHLSFSERIEGVL